MTIQNEESFSFKSLGDIPFLLSNDIKKYKNLLLLEQKNGYVYGDNNFLGRSWECHPETAAQKIKLFEQLGLVVIHQSGTRGKRSRRIYCRYEVIQGGEMKLKPLRLLSFNDFPKSIQTMIKSHPNPRLIPVKSQENTESDLYYINKNIKEEEKEIDPTTSFCQDISESELLELEKPLFEIESNLPENQKEAIQLSDTVKLFREIEHRLKSEGILLSSKDLDKNMNWVSALFRQKHEYKDILDSLIFALEDKEFSKIIRVPYFAIERFYVRFDKINTKRKVKLQKEMSQKQSDKLTSVEQTKTQTTIFGSESEKLKQISENLDIGIRTIQAAFQEFSNKSSFSVFIRNKIPPNKLYKLPELFSEVVKVEELENANIAA